MMEFLKKHWQKIVIGVFVIIIIIAISKNPPKYIGNPLYQDRIDTAEQRIKDSLAKLKYYQTLDSLYNKKIDTIQLQLNDLQVIKPQIRNYYTTTIQQVDRYTPKDIDTFLRNRYKY